MGAQEQRRYVLNAEVKACKEQKLGVSVIFAVTATAYQRLRKMILMSGKGAIHD